ncbi:MAG: ATP-binding cassette domain-containing protein [Paracoccus sp. (in: a-proteobacteria)]|nr:ATP-binding cassette domain-containing protein [Paracoccus sp. (in: a-proteobacteria)]
MLRLEGVSKAFGGVAVIRDLSLHVARGERVVLLGPNGAGKTSLLRLITGETAPDQGRIRLDGRDVTALAPDARARAGMGRGFQTAALFESFTLAENLILAEAARAARPLRDPLRDPALRQGAGRLADLVGLTGLGRPVARVDHGTRRRLDLAMALAGGPGLILLDEPASGFGPGGADEIHALIAGLPRDPAMILVEHDLDLAWSVADRIVILDAGRIRFDGAPEDARGALQALYDA